MCETAVRSNNVLARGFMTIDPDGYIWCWGYTKHSVIEEAQVIVDDLRDLRMIPKSLVQEGRPKWKEIRQKLGWRVVEVEIRSLNV